LFGRKEDFDAARHAGLTADQALALEREDHLVNGGRADAEIALHVGFGGRALEHMRIDIDEGEILALLFGEGLPAGHA